MSRTKRSRSSSARTWFGFAEIEAFRSREGRHLERRIGDEQRIELGELRRGEACEQSIRGALARPGPSRNGGAFDGRGRRKNDLRGA
jgi:hypothetical protein